MEQAKVAASARSMIFWCILLLMSLFLVIDSGDSLALAIWSLATAGIGFFAFLVRARSFGRNSDKLLKSGEVVRPYDHSSQVKKLVAIMLMTGAAFMAPLFLAAALTFGSWLGSLLGIIDGWVIGILLYNAYLLGWQNKHRGKLYTLQKWNGRTVTHTGLSFIRGVEVN